MSESSEDEVLAVLRASMGRRVLGVGSLGCLGVFLLYFGFSQASGSLLGQGFLIIAGAASIWLADTMRRATAHAVELTRRGLSSTDGEAIATFDEIEAVDRSIFAFKPSNGFLVRLKVKKARRWRPGLWWRYGRRVGVGGVTSASQAKAMSEIIAVLLFEQKK
ncbi:MAG: hypothetical protein AAGF53_13250 [Pseudomonadota bacterium]